MITNSTTISDYFPLCYDIAEAQNTGFSKPETVGLSAGELADWSSQNHLTELQTMTLLIKNAFEGHLCHLNDIPVAKLTESGTFQVDLGGAQNYRELTGDFFRNFRSYREGLESAWGKMVPGNASKENIDFGSMLYFILANQLFRFPVSFLKSYDPQRFIGIPELQRTQYRLHYLLQVSMLNHVAQWSFIEMVDEKYQLKFKDILLRLRSKEIVITQLYTKLNFANDPSIHTEEELEKMYFNFLIAINVKDSEKKKAKLVPEPAEVPEGRNFEQLLKMQIRKLYKVISKNCREVHNQIDGQEQFQYLSLYFMAANAVYHDLVDDFSSLMLQYSRLKLLFVKVINLRKINNLPVFFIDFTEIVQKQSVEIKEEDVIKCQNRLQASLELQQIFYQTDYKSKYIKDEELAEIHREFLNRQLRFLDQQISEILKEINEVMQNKPKIAG
jgi:hypothetical protein